MSVVARSVSGGAFIGLGIGGLVWAADVLTGLQQEDGDISAAGLLLIGLPTALLGLGAVVGGVLFVRSAQSTERDRPAFRVWIAVAAIAVAAAVAASGLAAAY